MFTYELLVKKKAGLSQSQKDKSHMPAHPQPHLKANKPCFVPTLAALSVDGSCCHWRWRKGYGAGSCAFCVYIYV